MDRWNLIHPDQEPKQSHLERKLSKHRVPTVVSSDYVKMVSEQIGPYVPGPYYALGTDGFGRSDTRENLRHFFEVDRYYIVLTAIRALALDGKIDMSKVNEVIKKYTSDPLNPALKKMDKHNTELLQKLGVIDEKEKKDLIKRIYSNIRNELNEIRYSNTNQVTFKLENMENAIKKAIEDPEIYNQNSQIIKNYSRYCWGVVFNVVDEIESSNLDEKNNKRNNLGIYMTEKITNYYLNQ